jgi:hypothetical protein
MDLPVVFLPFSCKKYNYLKCIICNNFYEDDLLEDVDFVKNKEWSILRRNFIGCIGDLRKCEKCDLRK